MLHGWGMTETTPLATLSRSEGGMLDWSDIEKYSLRAKQGWPHHLLKSAAQRRKVKCPWDGSTSGELEIRGPLDCGQYYKRRRSGRSLDGGRMVPHRRCGDYRRGRIRKDRRPDEGSGEVRRGMDQFGGSGKRADGASGGEGSVRGGDSTSEMAGAAAGRGGAARRSTRDQRCELRDFLRSDFAKWQLPDAFVFVDDIPRTSVGKFKKMALARAVCGLELEIIMNSSGMPGCTELPLGQVR